MDLNDKISEQVSVGVFSQIYPTNVIDTLVEQSPDVQKKKRRVRHFVAESVRWFVMVIGLCTRWSRGTGCDNRNRDLSELECYKATAIDECISSQYRRYRLGRIVT